MRVTLMCMILVVCGCNRSEPLDPGPIYPGTLVLTSADVDIKTGDVSPDGQYFADVNWSTGDFDLVDLHSADVRPITGRGFDHGRSAWTSAFSSSGQQIAASWYNYDTRAHELSIESLQGGESRLLIPAADDFFFVEPLDWSPSDQRIAVAMGGGGRNWQLVLVSTQDGSIEILRELGWEAPGGAHPQAYPHAAWSPDGALIAYDYPSADPENGQDIYAVAVDGGDVTPLVEGPGSDRFFSWSRDGSEILFYSDRSGSPSLWRQSVENGMPIGEPEILVSGVLGLLPMGRTESGFAFGVPEGPRNKYTASVDPTNGQILEAPQPVDQMPWHRNKVGDWSPDGKEFMYITFEPLPNPREYAVFASPSGALLRRVPFPHTFHNHTIKVSWISENEILVNGPLQGHGALYRFNIQTGTITGLPEFGRSGRFRVAEASPDGTHIYVIENNPTPRIVQIELETAERRVVTEATLNRFSMTVSPSGDEIAYLTGPNADGVSSIQAVNIASGGKRTILSDQAQRLSTPLAWTADGSRLLVGVRLPGEISGLWSVNSHGDDEAIFLDLPGAVGNLLRVSPDGNHVAFQAGIGYMSIRILEDF